MQRPENRRASDASRFHSADVMPAAEHPAVAVRAGARQHRAGAIRRDLREDQANRPADRRVSGRIVRTVLIGTTLTDGAFVDNKWPLAVVLVLSVGGAQGRVDARARDQYVQARRIFGGGRGAQGAPKMR